MPRINKPKLREILRMPDATLSRRLLVKKFVDSVGGIKDEISGVWTFDDRKVRDLANKLNPMEEIVSDAVQGIVDHPSEAIEAAPMPKETSYVTIEELQSFAGFIAAAFREETKKLLPPAQEKPTKKTKKKELAGFKDKQILNFSQALEYSGLPKEDLKKGLETGKIKFKKTSENGTYKISRKSLEEFCEDYFN